MYKKVAKARAALVNADRDGTVAGSSSQAH
jgi:hypothetical protein